MGGRGSERPPAATASPVRSRALLLRRPHLLFAQRSIALEMPAMAVARFQNVGGCEDFRVQRLRNAEGLAELVDDVLIRRRRAPTDCLVAVRIRTVPVGVHIAAGETRARLDVLGDVGGELNHHADLCTLDAEPPPTSGASAQTSFCLPHGRPPFASAHCGSTRDAKAEPWNLTDLAGDRAAGRGAEATREAPMPREKPVAATATVRFCSRPLWHSRCSASHEHV